MTRQEFYANRNDMIYVAYQAGAKYKALAIEHGLTDSGIKQILKSERKRRSIKKEKGNRQ